MKYKIYKTLYDLMPDTSEEVNAYAINGKLFDDPPLKGKFVGYVIMEDNSVIECYKKLNPIALLIVIIALALAAFAGIFIYIFSQGKDVSIAGLTIKVGDDQNIVSYNGFMTAEDDKLYIDFTNGSETCKIAVVGDGIEMEPLIVEPDQIVPWLPVKITSKDALINAQLKFKTETSEQVHNVVIEVPANNTENSPDESLAGKWKGEIIYDLHGTE